MIVTVFHGFCMALADSVPGVSGGTIAFILGFYERFLDALHDLFRGEGERRKAGLRYVLKLGLGWMVGMMEETSPMSEDAPPISSVSTTGLSNRLQALSRNSSLIPAFCRTGRYPGMSSITACAPMA